MSGTGKAKLVITYCVEWGFYDRAASLAASIEKGLGIKANLEEGHGGIFEVAIGGEVIYSNRSQCGGMPRDEEVLQILRERGQSDDQRPRTSDRWRKVVDSLRGQRLVG